MCCREVTEPAAAVWELLPVGPPPTTASPAAPLLRRSSSARPGKAVGTCRQRQHATAPAALGARDEATQRCAVRRYRRGATDEKHNS